MFSSSTYLNPPFTTNNVYTVDYQVQDNRYSLYDVYFYNDRIQTMVTSDPDMVGQWITDIESFYGHLLNVGLDIEWRPNSIPNQQYQNPAATLQLCVGRHCLIFQLLYCRTTPHHLISFLSKYTFFGVGIKDDVEKLETGCGLRVGNAVDSRHFAADAYGKWNLRTAGLKTLCREILKRDMEKPESISRSWWDNQWLSREQVQYACVDAFVSFEIATSLLASGYGYLTIRGYQSPFEQQQTMGNQGFGHY